MSDDRQTEIADFKDLRGVLRDAQRGHTIEFQSAVLAALLRIEQQLTVLRAEWAPRGESGSEERRRQREQNADDERD